MSAFLNSIHLVQMLKMGLYKSEMTYSKSNIHIKTI